MLPKLLQGGSLLIYIIKFLYETFLLPPGIYIFLMLILFFYLLKKKNKFAPIFFIFIFLFYLSSTSLIDNALIRSLENKYTPPSKISGDVIVVLGGGATLDTPNIGTKGHLSGSAANRLITAVELYNKLKVPIIFSGGKVYSFTGSEADIAKTILINMGIPRDKIIIDDKSLTTEENAKNTKKLLNMYSFTKPILVTSAFHMERSVIQFNKYDIKVTPFPTDYQTNVNPHFNINDLIPSSSAIDNLSISIKEYLGIIQARL